MFPYWLLFSIPALMALFYPVMPGQRHWGLANRIAAIAFAILYTLLAGLRFEIGGDWEAYNDIFDAIAVSDFVSAFEWSDPLYVLVNWVSSQMGMGIYLVNGVCAAILATGVVRAASQMEEPWLGILIAVPYLMIVVGTGYVRQGAAIGLILLAIASLNNRRAVGAAVYLFLASGFHSAAVLVLPIFAWPYIRRYPAAAVIFLGLAAYAYVNLLAPRMEKFEFGYIENEYESSGAVVRVAMSFFPSILLLARRKHLPGDQRVRAVWLSLALANCIAMAALMVVSSTTAIDRIALFFAIVQIVVFADLRSILGMGAQYAFVVRFGAVATAAAVQAVWLIYADHAWLWVPYRSILSSE